MATVVDEGAWAMEDHIHACYPLPFASEIMTMVAIYVEA